MIYGIYTTLFLMGYNLPTSYKPHMSAVSSAVLDERQLVENYKETYVNG